MSDQHLTAIALVDLLKAGDFTKVLTTIETGEVEFKGSPYRLEQESEKWELAKDVAALANAGGGVIAIGFSTAKDETRAIEYVDECRPFGHELFDIDRYRKVLDRWIHPPVRDLNISWGAGGKTDPKGVAYIFVPSQDRDLKPYLVVRTVDLGGRSRGTHFGFYERIQDRIPETTAETLRGYIRDGMRYSEIMQRLNTIEAFLGDSTSQQSVGFNDEEAKNRLVQVESAVRRDLRPNIILAASSTSHCRFPDLFHSRSAPVVELLEKPPLYRDDGFSATPKGRYNPSEIIEGKLRRVVLRGNKLTELWQDGFLLAIGPGDDDMLCWFMRNLTNPKPGLPIRNFVLAEVTLNFCRLALEIFKYASPIPKGIEFTVKLANMTDEGVPCSLSSVADNGPFVGGAYDRRDAPGSEIVGKITASFSSIDLGEVVYNLLGDLYAKFGFNYDDMPYTQQDEDARRITSESLFGQKLS